MMADNRPGQDPSGPYDEEYEDIREDILSYKDVPSKKNIDLLKDTRNKVRGEIAPRIDGLIYSVRGNRSGVIKVLKTKCAKEPTWSTICEFRYAQVKLDDFKDNVATHAKENQLKNTRVNQVWRIGIQRRKLIKRLKLLETKYSKKPTWETKTEIEYMREFLDDLHSRNNINPKEPYDAGTDPHRRRTIFALKMIGSDGSFYYCPPCKTKF